MKAKVIKAFEDALNKMGVETSVELTLAKGHGDFSTNVAMKLAKELGKSPRDIAADVVKNVKADFIEKIEIAGPGFINIFVKSDIVSNNVSTILAKQENFGRGNQGKFINVEYVSANPTGYLHLGHARGAALGSSLSMILEFAGNKVDQEYYTNDAGAQIDILGLAAWTRYQQEFGEDVSLPENSYRGQDIVFVAKELKKIFKDKYLKVPYKECEDAFKEEAKKMLLAIIDEHLRSFGVEFSFYSSEQRMYDDNLIKPALEQIKEHTYEKDGALWLDTTSKGDDKDRVLIKSDGKYTYLTPDVAYHKVKLDRGYDELINVWGGDHIGYIKRMSVALEYLGLPKDKLDVLTIQMVRLIKDGKELKMSKRLGTSFTLKELIELVGKDATRFYLLNRANTSPLDFDVNEAVKKSSDNPVFTIQYTYARARKLLAKGGKVEVGTYEGKEIELINLLMQFPELVLTIANTHKAHLMPQYLIEVARGFNSFYSNTKIIGEKREATLLALAEATMIVIANGLKLIGVSVPEGEM